MLTPFGPQKHSKFLPKQAAKGKKDTKKKSNGEHQQATKVVFIRPLARIHSSQKPLYRITEESSPSPPPSTMATH